MAAIGRSRDLRQVWLIARHEIGTRLRQPSFLLGAFGLPAVAWLLLGVAAWVNRDAPDLMGALFATSSRRGRPEWSTARGWWTRCRATCRWGAC